MSHVLKSVITLMDRYPGARRETFGRHPLHELVREIREGFWSHEAVCAHRSLKVKASVGQGNWAAIPSIAFLDVRETSTTRNGVFVIVLFREDMSGLYLMLNQGLALPSERLGRAPARAALLERAEAIRARFPMLRSLGFETTTKSVDFNTNAPAAADYRNLSVASRFFRKEDLEITNEFDQSLADALGVYDRYMINPVAIHLPRPVPLQK